MLPVFLTPKCKPFVEAEEKELYKRILFGKWLKLSSNEVMTDRCSSSLKDIVSKTNRNKCNSSINLKEDVHCKLKLKSSIPKPTPKLRSRCSVRTRSSSCSRPSRIPLAVRGGTCAPTSPRHQAPRPPHPQAARSSRNTNPRTQHGPKVKITQSPLNDRLVATPDSTITESSRVKSLDTAESSVNDESAMTNYEFLQQQRKLVKLYNYIKALQVPQELKPLEAEIRKLIQSKTLTLSEGINNVIMLSEGSPEFLSTLESQMQEVAEAWLRLIRDIVTANLVASPGVPFPDPAVNLRDEMSTFLSSLPYEGEALQEKLERVEKEQLRVVTVVSHGAVTLWKEYEELRDRHSRLEKTQDQIHFELKEQLAILVEENQELDRKYQQIVEKYSLEKTKTDRQEKYRLKVNREMADMKNHMKVFDGKLDEWDTKATKLDHAYQHVQVVMKQKGNTFEKERKTHQETLQKLKESKETIHTLESELTENNQKLMCAELTNKELKDELMMRKEEVGELELLRNKMYDEIRSKTKKILEMEEKINTNQACSTSGSGVKEVYDDNLKISLESNLKESRQKDLYIQELKKEVSNFENILKDKSVREEELKRQVAELQKQPRENEVVLRAQIKELQSELKDALEERAELERMVAERRLELDQRDLLLREHEQVVRTRDELLPLAQGRHNVHVERLRAVLGEQRRAHFNQGDKENSSNGEPNLHEVTNALDEQHSLDHSLGDKELTFRQEKMNELFNLLEHKELEMMRLENRIRELQEVREEKDKLEMEKEARICLLQKELEEIKYGTSSGIFSLFSAQER